MNDQTEEYLAWVKADQEQAELEHRAINSVQAAAFALLEGLTHNWQRGTDMANDPKERQKATFLLIWCGALEARFDFSLFSDAGPVRAQAIVAGMWDPRALLGEAQRQLGQFLRGTASAQADAQWDLRLTSEGERLQHELRKHPENKTLIWDYILSQRLAAKIGMRLLEGPQQHGASAVAVAGARASASVGNIVIQNQVDLGQLAALLAPKLKAPQAADGDRNQETAPGAKGGSGEQRWRDDAPEYLPLTEIRKLIDGKLSLQTLGRLCKPDGQIRYMRRRGLGCRMHIADFRLHMKGRQSDPQWAAAYMHWLKGQKAGTRRLFWKCGNNACGHQYADEANASDVCPKCKSQSELILKPPPKPSR
jgi:hypothetical protein